MNAIAPTQVHELLGRHMLADGFSIVCDLERSHGVWLHDSRSGREYLDLISFFASLPLGFNHPRLVEPEFVAKLGRVAVHKPSLSDIYTVEMAEAVATFYRYALPPYLHYMFFVEGGALGVENCLKTAFDWKVRKNFARGCREERGHQVIHFQQAFHGRSGYTLSLTNTADARKTRLFPKFEWPRIENPRLDFPLTEESLTLTIAAEGRALDQINDAIREHGEDIAALIIEPIQAEGGDNHFRGEFLAALRRVCDQHEILLIFDEVQSGMGLTGRLWAHEHFAVQPDMLAFCKKAQVGGMMCSRRIDDVPEHVFAEESRINSTFGGNLTDMVRAARILEVIFEEDLLGNAARVGEHLRAGLEAVQAELGKISNARGRGLMCAIDLPSAALRDQLRRLCFEEGLILLGCGERTVRFRPALNITVVEVDEALARLRRAVARL